MSNEKQQTAVEWFEEKFDNFVGKTTEEMFSEIKKIKNIK
jgi:hypothetical protein